MTISEKRQIIGAAFRTRARMGIPSDSCFCIFDAVRELGVDVRFLGLDSLEGMYCRSFPPTIMVSSRRPDGRQRFTCAHELSHHVFGHGESLSPALASEQSRKRRPEELHADLFGAHLLMPATLVTDLFRQIGTAPEDATAIQVFAVSCSLGVGYSTLLNHLEFGLRILPSSSRQLLDKQTPRSLRQQLEVPEGVRQMLLLGKAWRGRPLDVCLGGYVLVERRDEHFLNSQELLAPAGGVGGFYFFCAQRVGQQQMSGGTLSSVRVYDPNFEGRAAFRFDAIEDE